MREGDTLITFPGEPALGSDGPINTGLCWREKTDSHDLTNFYCGPSLSRLPSLLHPTPGAARPHLVL
jgi:hypothetical protein